MMFIMHISTMLAYSVLLMSTFLLIWCMRNEGAGNFLGKTVGVIVFFLSLLSIICISITGVKYWKEGKLDDAIPMEMSKDIQNFLQKMMAPQDGSNKPEMGDRMSDMNNMNSMPNMDSSMGDMNSMNSMPNMDSSMDDMNSMNSIPDMGNSMGDMNSMNSMPDMGNSMGDMNSMNSMPNMDNSMGDMNNMNSMPNMDNSRGNMNMNNNDSGNAQGRARLR